MSCSGVCTPKIETSGPTGMIAKLISAGVAARIGARENRSLSTCRGTMSSFSGSLSASATGWSSPKGPQRFGPGRFCMRPMTRRSAQIMKIWNSSRNRKMTTTLMAMIHQTRG